MTLRSFLQELQSKKIKVVLQDNELKIKAPKGALNESLILKIKERKQEILDYLKEQNNRDEQFIEPVKMAESYPVSDGQRRLWVLHQMEKNSVSYNLPQHLFLAGDYHIDNFKKAINAVVDRHEILRTIILQDEKGELRQFVVNKEQFSHDILYSDVSEHSNPLAHAEQYMQDDLGIAFDLEKGPLFRIALFKLKNQEYLFYFNMHHIISDGWSMSVLTNDIMAFYKAYNTNTPVDLPALKIHYKDYSVWQLNQLQTEQFENHRAYWKNELSGDLPSIDLPFSNNRPPVKTQNGYLLETYISSEITASLQAFCKAQRSTIYTGLLAVLNALLHRYTSQEEFIIGSPFAGRERTELQNQIGFYINTLAIRNKVDKDDSFKALFSKVKEKTLEAQIHKEYPFDRLVNELDVNRDVSRNPIFDILLVLNNIDNESKDSIAIPANQINTIIGTDIKVSKVDLEVIFSEIGGCLSFKIIFNPDIYEQRDIEQMMVHYKQLLGSLLAHPETSLANINYLSESESNKLSGFNETFVDYTKDKGILDLFRDKVEQFPDNIAVSYNDAHLTLKELDELSNQFSRFLQTEYHIESNNLVGIRLERSEWMLVSILGILKSGGAFVSVGTDYPEERIAYIQTDSNYKVCIDDAELNKFRANQDQYEKTVVEIDHSPENIAYALYTSGSTGMPKGVLNHYAGLRNRLLWMRDYLNADETSVILQKTPYTFDVSVWELLLPLITGCELVFAKPDGHKDPEYIQEIIDLKKITIIHFVPSVLRLFIDGLDISKSSSLKHLVCSGEVLPAQMVRDFRNTLTTCRIHNLYGPTEAAIDVTAIDVSDIDSEATEVSIGFPVANSHIYIVNESLCLQPIGIPGELLIGGIQVSKGYLNRPALNKSSFLESPFKKGEKLYRTGDIAKWSEEGFIYYQGRADNQVKISGQRIELEEISYHLREKDSIKSAIVLVKENDVSEKKLVAYLVSEASETSSELQDFLAPKLPMYMIPSSFIQVSEIPLTSNGKVDRKKLLALEGAEITSGIAYRAPRNAFEKELINIWEEVLKQDEIGIDHNYFAIGGDSMKAIKIISETNKRLDISAAISDIYSYQTIRSFSDATKDSLAQNSDQQQSTEGYNKITAVKLLVEKENNGFQNKMLPNQYEDIYPLVPIEEGMIYSSMLHPEEPIYYDKFVYAVNVENYQHLVSAIESLIERHAILRTLYYMNNFSQPVKAVLKTVQAPITKTDLTHLSEKEQILEIKSIREKDLKNRFQFNGELLYDYKIIKLTDTDYYIIWSFHHAMLDGWSIAVFSQELSVLLSNDQEKKLPELRYNYKDYCALVLGRKNSKESHSYWKETLDGYTRNKLPFNYTGLKINNDLGMKSVFETIGSETVRNIELVCEQNSVSFKSVCVAAYTYLMHILCSENDVVAGVVSHDRPGLENGDKILGCFLNTVPIRVDFNKLNDTLSLIKFVNNYLIETHKHEVHLGEISQFIGEKPSSSNPIFDTLINYTHFHIMDEFDSKSTISSSERKMYDDHLAASDEMTNTLFDVEVNRKMDSIGLRIKYVPSLFTPEDVKEALNMFTKLLVEFSKGEKTTLSPVLTMSAADVKEVLYDYNDTFVTLNKGELLHELFENQVQKAPTNIALRQDGKSLTYKELNDTSNQIANYLLEQGVTPGTNVGILATRSFDMITGLLGILKSGGSYVPIDPKYPVNRQRYIIENSDVEYIITNIENAPIEGLTDVTFLNIVDNLQILTQKTENPKVEIKDSQLAYTIYTSGSTGTPKGVMIEHQSIVNLVRWVNEEFGINEKDRLLFITSICFDLSVYDVFGILAAGGAVVIAREEEIQNITILKNLLQSEQITFWDSVPTTFNYLIDELAEEQLGYKQLDLRLVFMSGDWIPVQLPEKAIEYFPNTKVISLGGATEGTVWSNYYPIHSVNPDWSSIPYGKPFRNNFFYILDDNMQPVPKGTVGELFIGGIGVARGYANNPEKTKDAFRKDPFNTDLGGRVYKTGDLGRWKRDGNMEFIGRKDNQVKIRGFRVELGEIDSMILKNPIIKESIVSTFKDFNNNNQLCAYIVPFDAENFDKKVLKEYLKEVLPLYMVPNYYVQLDALPLNSNGKIDRKALPGIDDNAIIKKEFLAPKNELESRLVTIWQGLLKNDTISVSDDFFDLGANSLTLVSLQNKILKEFDKKAHVSELYEFTSIREQALLLESKDADSSLKIEKIPESTHYELSPSQLRFWLIDKLRNQVANTNYILFQFDMGENLDVKIFNQTLKTIVDRHEMFRTIFVEEQGIPKQKVLAPDAIDNSLISIEAIENRTSNENNNSWETMTNFTSDLSDWPLFKFEIVKEDNGVVWYGAIHHILVDGWSMEILKREFLQIYENIQKETTPQLPELRIQYKDYAKWQNDLLKEGAFKPSEQYWLNQLENLPAKIKLPKDIESNEMSIKHTGIYQFYISEDLKTDMDEFLRSKKVGLFPFLISCFKILINRITSEKDIVIGTPVANRNNDDVNDIVGLFINTLMIRNQLDDSLPFEQYLNDVNTSFLKTLEHQSYPFEWILEKIKYVKEDDNFPITNIFLNMLNFEGAKQKTNENLSNINSFQFERMAKFDLECYFEEFENTLKINCAYRSDMFKEKTIAYWMENFISIIQQTVNDQTIALENIQLFETFLTVESPVPSMDFNTFEAIEIEQSIISRFEKQVEKYPNNKAVVHEGNALSYTELNNVSNNLGHHIQDTYNTTKSNIGLLLEHGTEAIIGMLGVLKTGNVYVPLDTNHPIDRINLIINDISCEVLIISNATLAIAEKIKKEKPTLRFINISEISISNSENLSIDIVPDNQAYILYTSGSTGTPKGVVQNHRNVLHFIRVYTNNLHISSDDKVSLLPIYAFDSSVMDIYGALLSGATLHIHDLKKYGVNSIADWITENKISILHTVPTIYRYFINSLSNTHLFKDVRLVVLGGEGVFKTDFKSFQNHFSEDAIFVNGYGPTESTITMQKYLGNHSEQDSTKVSIGTSVTDTEVLLLNEKGNEIGVYQVGELVYRSKYLALGYYNNDELTNKFFSEDPLEKGMRRYQSGDLGKLLPTGEVEFFGRKDKQIKYNGQRIELSEIEQALIDIETIEEAVVLLKTDHNTEYLLSYLKATEEVSPDFIKDKLSEKLPIYMIPMQYRFLETFPQTQSGKTNRLALSELPVEIVKKEFIKASNEVEENLLVIWSKILSIDANEISVNANFFDLGGNSLMVLEMLKEINLKMPLLKDITIMTLFRFSTIATLANYFSNESEVENDEPIEELFEAKEEVLNILFNDSLD